MKGWRGSVALAESGNAVDTGAGVLREVMGDIRGLVERLRSARSAWSFASWLRALSNCTFVLHTLVQLVLWRRERAMNGEKYRFMWD